MAVTLTQEVEGLNVGDTYSGADEAWLLAEGYASQAGYATDTAAVLTAGSNAVNVVTGGNVVLKVNATTYTVAIASADTPAQAATKIDTALSGVADAAIVSSKLVITSTALGDGVELRVVSGTGTVLANLGLTAGASARGTQGGPGVANTGPADTTVANNPLFDADRTARAIAGGTPEAATNDNLVLSDANDPIFANEPADGFTPEVNSITPATGAAAGGVVVKIRGHYFREVTGVKFDTTDGTAFSKDGQTITVTAPAHAAGAVDVTLVKPGTDVVEEDGFTYTA